MNSYKKNDKNIKNNIFSLIMLFKIISVTVMTILFSLSSAFCQNDMILALSPDNRSVSYTSGSTTFSIANIGYGTMNWTASESSDWVILPVTSGTNNGTITAIYQTNTSTSPRTCVITVTAPDAIGSPQNITIVQVGTTPVLAVAPSNREAGYNSGSTTFSVTNTGTGIMNWTATASKDWVTLSDSTGTNTGSITATYQANNTTSSRTCTITVTAPDATGSPKNITINQAGTTPVLAVTPVNRDVSYISGSIKFSVTNTGTGIMNWSASESSDWVILSDSSGTNTGIITANYAANNSPLPRTCTITVTAPDATGSPKNITINQLGTTPVLAVAPVNREVSYAAGSTMFSISNTGNGIMDWTVSESSDWVTLSDSSGTNTGTITATFMANNSILPRTCTITVTAPDATGSPRNITISQAGTMPELSVAPVNRDVNYIAGSTTFSVTNQGSGIMNWVASESSDWVTLSDSTGTNTGTITATYLTNNSASSRTCTITVTAPEANESPQNIIINQSGTTPELSVAPANRDVNYFSGSTTFSVSNTGSGIINWTATESSDWVTLVDGSGTNNGTITAIYLTNNSTSARSCTITVTAPGANDSPQSVTISQAGTKSVLSISPANRDVVYASGQTAFSVNNTGSGTMTWTASESSDWVTLTGSSGTNSGTISAIYTANNTTALRTCIITVTATDSDSDVTGSPQSITINQAGTKAILSVNPINRDMSSTSGSTTFLVSNTGSGTMKWIASESSDWVTLSDSSGTNSGTIIATCLANNTKSPKTCIITITASDSASEAIGSPKEITILQQAKLETEEEDDRDGWGSSNILASNVKEEFLAPDGTKLTGDFLKCEIFEDKDVSPLPKIIASTASDVFRIKPEGIFNQPVSIKIPLNPKVKPGNLGIYYYSESPSHAGWYSGENVDGWMEPGSIRIISENGQSFYEFAVNHSGIVQIGENQQVSLGGASIDLGMDGSSRNWRLFAVILILISLCLAGILRKHHPSKHSL